jgi:hypothetical protein
MNTPDKFEIKGSGTVGAIAGNTGKGKARNIPDKKVEDFLKVLDERRAEIERESEK